MGRIRTIKPDFFTSRSLSRVSVCARLTYAGLWCQADDHGRGVADTRILKGAIWPLDDDVDPDTILLYLRELSSTGHLDLYDVNGDLFYEVTNWTKHQAAAYRRGDAKYPPKAEGTLCTFLHDSARPVVQESAYKERTDGRDEPVISEAINAYVVAVCLEAKNTSQRYRDAVKDNAVRERAPMLREALKANPDATVDDMRELLGMDRLEKPAPTTANASERDPNCEHCAGSGWRTIDHDRNVVGECDCLPSFATVTELRPA